MYLWHITSSPCSVGKMTKEGKPSENMCICKREYVHCVSLCVLLKRACVLSPLYVPGVCLATRQRDGVTARWMRYAWGRAERLKESSLRGRRRRLCESPSPAVLLVDAHVHFPGSVFRDPPMRHQQTDTCGEKRHARADQQAAGRAHTWHTPAQLSGLFTEGDS